jgi:flagellar basal-body rod protein FlgB
MKTSLLTPEEGSDLNIFTSDVKSLLVQAMDAAALRNEVLANNIANVDTPDFKRQEVAFEELLRMQLTQQAESASTLPLVLSHRRHIALTSQEPVAITPLLREIDELTYRNDGNNVDFDVESTKIGENKILYDAYVQCMSNEGNLLRIAITGRSS